MGESLMISSMAFMQTSLQMSTALNSMLKRWPIRISASPIISEDTMICSMFPSTKGARKLEGKMPTSVSIKLTPVAEGV